LIVSNHGFGAALDLNVFALLSVLDDISDRPITYLTHQMAWTLQAHHLLEPLGCVPATTDNARAAIAAGHHVVVFPGGDVEAARTHHQRNQIVFSGRTGFAQLALDLGIPVVPVVTAGAGNTVFVLNDGQSIARSLRFDRLMRCKAVPISISIPWGLNVGLVGLLPYLPMPAQLSTSVLQAVSPGDSDTAGQLADRVVELMATELAALANP
jgi:1-acyl-sn-glycerol-3-phosphate acyltransferase